MLEARRPIQNLKAYHPPLSGRRGLRLDFNENTQGPSPKVLRVLQQLTADDLVRYPEREPVERLAAERFCVSPQQVLLTNGVDEAIQLLCQTYLEPGCEALIVVPAFAMYELLASSTGAKVISVPALSDFRFPTQSLLDRITPATRLIAMANPNNPTGVVARPEEILQVARAAADAAVLVDEAYFDFYGETLLSEISRVSNLFVARTFSKAYGLAGLRAGALFACAESLQMVRRVASPYNVNAVALACLPAALDDRDFVEQYAAEIRRGRTRLESAYRSLGIRYWPSQGNFVLADFGSNAQRLVAEMNARGILVRDRSSDPGCQGCVRITIGTAEQMDRLLTALEETVRSLSLPERSLA